MYSRSLPKGCRVAFGSPPIALRRGGEGFVCSPSVTLLCVLFSRLAEQNRATLTSGHDSSFPTPFLQQRSQLTTPRWDSWSAAAKGRSYGTSSQTWAAAQAGQTPATEELSSGRVVSNVTQHARVSASTHHLLTLFFFRERQCESCEQIGLKSQSTCFRHVCPSLNTVDKPLGKPDAQE